MSKAEQKNGTRLNCVPHIPFICSPQKKTAQSRQRAYAFITETRHDHALNNTVKEALEFSWVLQYKSRLFNLN